MQMLIVTASDWSQLSGKFSRCSLERGGWKSSLPCFEDYSVSSSFLIFQQEENQRFISQTIEKLLDGIVPETEEYILVLLAAVLDVTDRKLHLSQIYSNYLLMPLGRPSSN